MSETVVKKKGIDIIVVDDTTDPTDPCTCTCTGEPGPTGPMGPEGPAGPAGEKGDKGDKGDTGDIGPAGAQGLPGIQGIQGEQGTQGVKGDAGNQGAQGPIGPAGPIGLTGPTGATGASGPKGDPGATGPAGATGATGPQGPKGDTGETGPMGPAGTGGTRRGEYDVYAYGAKGDGATDDTNAFQAAIDAARNGKGTLVIPPASSSFKITRTLNVVPDASNQVWMDIQAKGRAGEIRYYGPSGTPVFKVIGLKGAKWEGLNVAISGGQTDCQIFDIQTTVAANSSSFNTFKTFYLNLGNGTNNIGVRTGAVDGGANDGKDISNYNFENLIVFGNRANGQYAFQNLGMNTLSMAWYGGFVAFCDRVYSNISSDGTKRGNGAVAFYGLGGSHNKLDFYFAFEQSYIISGGRWEVGDKFLKTSDGAYASVLVEGLVIHDYTQENVIEASNATSLTLKGVQISKTFGGVYNSCILLSANGRNGVLNMQNCALSSNTLYTKTGTTLWDITALGISKLDGVWSNGFYPNEIGVRK